VREAFEAGVVADAGPAAGGITGVVPVAGGLAGGVPEAGAGAGPAAGAIEGVRPAAGCMAARVHRGAGLNVVGMQEEQHESELIAALRGQVDLQHQLLAGRAHPAE